MIIEENRKI